MSYQPAPPKLKRRVHAFMERRGRLYHRIPHPDFEGLPAIYDDHRLEVLKPHLAFPGGTVLDIGTHWGQLAHWLEGLGYRVTAVEHSPNHAYIARGVRDICGKKFEIIEGSIFDIKEFKYDIVLAMNIFHHFLKSEDRYNNLVTLLGRLDCSLMFLQTHSPTEKQMDGAYRNMDQDEFAAFISEKSGLRNVKHIGAERKRKIYKLWR